MHEARAAGRAWRARRARRVVVLALVGATVAGCAQIAGIDDIAYVAAPDDAGSADAAGDVGTVDAAGDSAEGEAGISVPRNGLVAEWLFDETPSQLAHDSSGNGHDLVMGGSTGPGTDDPAWNAEALEVCNGLGLRFNGSGTVATGPAGFDLPLPQFTVSFWLRLNGNGTGMYGRVLSREPGQAIDDLEIDAANQTVNVLQVTTDGNKHQSTSDGSTPLVGIGHSVAITYDDNGDRTAHIYVDGTEVGYSGQDAVVGQLKVGTAPLLFGNRAAGDRGLEGTLDEIRIYARVLNAGEISQLEQACKH